MTRFTIIQTSEFNLFNRYISGENIGPICEQRQQVGFNALRVWTAYNIPLIGRLIPKEHLDYYNLIPPFMAFIATYGLYAEWTAWTGPYTGIFDSQSEMVAHFNALKTVLPSCSNILDLEAINEGDNGPNLGAPLDQIEMPLEMLSSHGSAIQDAPPMLPVWSVAGHHPASNEWWRKVGHNAMADVAEVYHVPAWSNETTRMPDNDSNPQHAYDAAAAAALLCAGSCFHSPEGKNSTLWTGRSLQCAQAWADGARSVPLEFQAGRYSRRDDPAYLRVYRRTLNDGRFWEVPIRF